MDEQPPIECICGSGNFERVVVRRPNGNPYRTEFLARTECRVMYFDPEPKVEPPAAWVSLMPNVDPWKAP